MSQRRNRHVGILLAFVSPSVAAGCGTASTAGPGPQPPTVASPAAAPPAEPAPSPGPDPALGLVVQAKSREVSWKCVGSPCPWGASLTGNAVVWPDSTRALNTRLGYTVSEPIYLPAASANGTKILILNGSATLNAGPPDRPKHRAVTTLEAGGKPYRIVGITPGNVVSVQSETSFTYEVMASSGHGDTLEADGAVHAVLAFWSCNVADCTTEDWKGQAIPWPKGTAYQSNGRTGVNSRSVYTLDGDPVYAYMGPWADGCKVTAKSGEVQVVEWKRGSDKWRKTFLKTGQSHTIKLTPPEDGALIESIGDATSPGFSVSFENCTPRPVPGHPGKS